MVGARRLRLPAVDPAVLLEPWVDALIGLEDVEHAPVVGCSGGVDSVALLALVVATGRAPTAVYVDHGLRAAGAAEAAFVARVGARLGVATRAVAVDVAPGSNLEARARAARYGALEDVRREVGAASLLVGHTADDQAETVVLNFMRGSGSAGLGGMAVRRGTIVRPLLRLRRTDCEAVCAAIAVAPLRDPMNDDAGFRRVAVRHDMLPRLSALAGRDLTPVLARQADILRGESDYLDALARAAWPPGEDRAPARVLANLPLPLARRAVRQWVASRMGSPPPTSADVDRILAVARGDIRATEVSGGHRVVRRAGGMWLERATVGP